MYATKVFHPAIYIVGIASKKVNQFCNYCLCHAKPVLLYLMLYPMLERQV